MSKIDELRNKIDLRKFNNGDTVTIKVDDPFKTVVTFSIFKRVPVVAITAPNLSTGYFGRPNEPISRVHIVRDGKPICGSNPHKDAEYYFCANGVNRQYLNCDHCRRYYDKWMEEYWK